MERKIRKRYKMARASWKRAAAKSAKAETSKRRAVALVALVLAALATSGRVAGVAFGAETPPRPVLTMDDAHRCAFRVVASSNGATATQVGSGTTIARLKNEWLGATNAHVVDGCGVFAMQYFGDGRPVCVDAKLVGKFYDSARGLDFALLAASRSALDAYNPPVAPLAPPERARLDAASPILSVGCPEAREPQAWRGRVTGQFGEVRNFKPAPLQGQSGSGILQFSPETGVYETRALVTYRTDPSALRDADFDAAEGGALEFALLYDALTGGVATGSGGGNGGGGVPIPRSRTSAVDATERLPFVPCVATVDLEEAAETEENAASQEEDSTDVDAASQDAEKEESCEDVDAMSQKVGSTSDLPQESECSAVGASNAETNVNDLTKPSTSAPLVAETVAAEPGDGPTLPVELEEAALPAVAVGGKFGPDFEPSTAAEAVEAFASGWSPFRPGAGGVPESSDDAAGGGSGDADGSTDSTAGLIGGAIDRAAREKVEALAAELEKAARERIATVAEELEAAARLKLDAAAVAVESAATAKIASAVDGLKRRAGTALAAVGVWGAFAAGAWYWLVRGLAKCWGSAPKYRLVRDDDGTSQASNAGSD